MSGNVHPNPGPIFPCSVCAGNVTWRGKSVQCCTCSKWVHLRCSQLSLSKFKALGAVPSCRNAVSPSSDFSDMHTSTVQSGPPPLMLHFCPTLVFKPLIHHLLILYLLPLPPLHRPLLLAVLLRLLPLLLPLDSLRVLQWNVGGLGAGSTELLFRPILSTSSASRHPILTHFPVRIPEFSALRSDRTHSRSGILSHDATRASGGVILFVWQGLFFSALSTSSLRLIPTLIM